MSNFKLKLKKSGKYIIPLLVIIIMAFLLMGLQFLTHLIFDSASSADFGHCLGMALGLYAIETGARPTEDGRKSDLQVLAVLFVLVIIATVCINLRTESMEVNKLILWCATLAAATFAAYFGMYFYTKWADSRKRKKQNIK